MLPPERILTVWRKFDRFPMDTLTKAWYHQFGTKRKQRNVTLMKEHREQYGIAGNCFDLAIWLLDEFQKEGIEAYPIGSDMGTPEAHAAVIALDNKGNRYLCDLGDQWIEPILLEANSEDFTEELLEGFFPGAKVKVSNQVSSVEIQYHRPNGKVSIQGYHLSPIEMSEFLDAAEFSQNYIYPRPLVECRVPFQSEVGHWEFNDWNSFYSLNTGLIEERKLETIEEWADRINERTGYDLSFVKDALNLYKS